MQIYIYVSYIYKYIFNIYSRPTVTRDNLLLIVITPGEASTNEMTAYILLLINLMLRDVVVRMALETRCENILSSRTKPILLMFSYRMAWTV